MVWRRRVEGVAVNQTAHKQKGEGQKPSPFVRCGRSVVLVFVVGLLAVKLAAQGFPDHLALIGVGIKLFFGA